MITVEAGGEITAIAVNIDESVYLVALFLFLFVILAHLTNCGREKHQLFSSIDGAA